MSLYPFYLHAHAADGSEFLGNLEGQGGLSWHYKRTLRYRLLLKGEFRSLRVHHWTVQTTDDKIVETIPNPNYKG